MNLVPNSLYHADCLDGLARLAPGSVQLVVADPPYVVSRDSNFHTMKDRKNERTGTQFGVWDEEFDNQAWLDLAAAALGRDGSLLVFNDFKKASVLVAQAEAAGLIYKDTLIWEKTNPMPRNRDRRYAPNVEMMMWFVKKGAKWTFNRQDDSYERCVVRCASESGGGFTRYHPTQKPVKLLQHLIRIHSNPGDLVLDPFGGSGATACACLTLGRDYLLFERDAAYCTVAAARLGSLADGLTAGLETSPSTGFDKSAFRTLDAA